MSLRNWIMYKMGIDCCMSCGHNIKKWHNQGDSYFWWVCPNCKLMHSKPKN